MSRFVCALQIRHWTIFEFALQIRRWIMFEFALQIRSGEGLAPRAPQDIFEPKKRGACA